MVDAAPFPDRKDLSPAGPAPELPAPGLPVDELHAVAAALGGTVVAAATLTGGFSHETCLLTLAASRVVVRFGGPDPAIEAAVMTVAGRHVPVPRVLTIVAPTAPGHRPAMVVEYVSGTVLSQVLAADPADPAGLGAEVGRVAAGIAAASFERPGFFADRRLTVDEQRPWSAQLPGFAASCVAGTPQDRLAAATGLAWVELCAAHAPALRAVDDQARLVHADFNPKNILVTRAAGGWRVDAVLDWEFSFSGCPYGDAANMARFDADQPSGFLDGFQDAFAAAQPAGGVPAEEQAYLGRVLDMFALSDLLTRPPGHPTAAQAAAVVRRWVARGVPGRS